MLCFVSVQSLIPLKDYKINNSRKDAKTLSCECNFIRGCYHSILVWRY